MKRGLKAEEEVDLLESLMKRSMKRGLKDDECPALVTLERTANSMKRGLKVIVDSISNLLKKYFSMKRGLKGETYDKWCRFKNLWKLDEKRIES